MGSVDGLLGLFREQFAGSLWDLDVIVMSLIFSYFFLQNINLTFLQIIGIYKGTVEVCNRCGKSSISFD